MNVQKASLSSRLGAGALALLLFLSQAALPHAVEANIWSERRAASAVRLARLPQSLPLPAPRSALASAMVPALSAPRAAGADSLAAALQPFATVRASEGAGPRTVIHILDVHRNAEAQRNIAGAVRAALDTHGADVVAVEGAFAPVAAAAIRAIAEEPAVRMALDFLAREFRVSGAVHAALTGSGAVPIVGIDDEAAYRRNVAALRRAAPSREANRRRIAGWREAWRRAANGALNPALRAFLQAEDRFRSGSGEAVDYFSRLVSASGSSSPAIARFLQAAALENAMDWSAIEDERDRLVRRLSTRLPPETMARLVERAAAFRDGAESHAAFYRYLIADLGETARTERYPRLRSYLAYLDLAAGIDGDALYAEVDRLRAAAVDGLVITAAERELVARHRRIGDLEKLASFGFTPRDWRRFQLSPDADLRLIDQPAYEDFYRAAEARDAAMARRLLDGGDWTAAILVTGGFHAPGLTNRLREANCRVIRVSPRLSRVDGLDGGAYLSVFTQETSPLDRLLSGERLFLADHPAQLSLLGPLALGAAVAQADDAFDRSRLSPLLSGGATIKARRIASKAAEVVSPNGRLRVYLTGETIARVVFIAAAAGSGSFLGAIVGHLPAGFVAGVSAGLFAALPADIGIGRSPLARRLARWAAVAAPWAAYAVVRFVSPSITVALPTPILFSLSLLLLAVIQAGDDDAPSHWRDEWPRPSAAEIAAAQNVRRRMLASDQTDLDAPGNVFVDLVLRERGVQPVKVLRAMYWVDRDVAGLVFSGLGAEIHADLKRILTEGAGPGLFALSPHLEPSLFTDMVARGVSLYFEGEWIDGRPPFIVRAGEWEGEPTEKRLHTAPRLHGLNTLFSTYIGDRSLRRSLFWAVGDLRWLAAMPLDLRLSLMDGRTGDAALAERILDERRDGRLSDIQAILLLRSFEAGRLVEFATTMTPVARRELVRLGLIEAARPSTVVEDHGNMIYTSPPTSPIFSAPTPTEKKWAADAMDRIAAEPGPAVEKAGNIFATYMMEKGRTRRDAARTLRAIYLRDRALAGALLASIGSDIHGLWGAILVDNDEPLMEAPILFDLFQAALEGYRDQTPVEIEGKSIVRTPNLKGLARLMSADYLPSAIVKSIVLDSAEPLWFRILGADTRRSLFGAMSDGELIDALNTILETADAERDASVIRGILADVGARFNDVADRLSPAAEAAIRLLSTGDRPEIERAAASADWKEEWGPRPTTQEIADARAALAPILVPDGEGFGGSFIRLLTSDSFTGGGRELDFDDLASILSAVYALSPRAAGLLIATPQGRHATWSLILKRMPFDLAVALVEEAIDVLESDRPIVTEFGTFAVPRTGGIFSQFFRPNHLGDLGDRIVERSGRPGLLLNLGDATERLLGLLPDEVLRPRLERLIARPADDADRERIRRLIAQIQPARFHPLLDHMGEAAKTALTRRGVMEFRRDSWEWAPTPRADIARGHAIVQTLVENADGTIAHAGRLFLDNDFTDDQRAAALRGLFETDPAVAAAIVAGIPFDDQAAWKPIMESERLEIEVAAALFDAALPATAAGGDIAYEGAEIRMEGVPYGIAGLFVHLSERRAHDLITQMNDRPLEILLDAFIDLIEGRIFALDAQPARLREIPVTLTESQREHLELLIFKIPEDRLKTVSPGAQVRFHEAVFRARPGKIPKVKKFSGRQDGRAVGRLVLVDWENADDDPVLELAGGDEAVIVAQVMLFNSLLFDAGTSRRTIKGLISYTDRNEFNHAQDVARTFGIPHALAPPDELRDFADKIVVLEVEGSGTERSDVRIRLATPDDIERAERDDAERAAAKTNVQPKLPRADAERAPYFLPYGHADLRDVHAVGPKIANLENLRHEAGEKNVRGVAVRYVPTAALTFSAFARVVKLNGKWDRFRELTRLMQEDLSAGMTLARYRELTADLPSYDGDETRRRYRELRRTLKANADAAGAFDWLRDALSTLVANLKLEPKDPPLPLRLLFRAFPRLSAWTPYFVYAVRDFIDRAGFKQTGVFIRTSSNAEDLWTKELIGLGAGGYGTEQNVRSRTAMLSSLKQAWRSAWNGGVFANRRDAGIDETQVFPAVGFNPRIDADYSFVAITTHRSDRTQGHVSFVQGLGESLLGDQRVYPGVPAEGRWDKETGAIIPVSTWAPDIDPKDHTGLFTKNTKTVMAVPDDDGGVLRKPVDGQDLANQFHKLDGALQKRLIAALAEAARDAERVFGVPQRLEGVITRPKAAGEPWTITIVQTVAQEPGSKRNGIRAKGRSPVAAALERAANWVRRGRLRSIFFGAVLSLFALGGDPVGAQIPEPPEISAQAEATADAAIAPELIGRDAGAEATARVDAEVDAVLRDPNATAVEMAAAFRRYRDFRIDLLIRPEDKNLARAVVPALRAAVRSGRLDIMRPRMMRVMVGGDYEIAETPRLRKAMPGKVLMDGLVVDLTAPQANGKDRTARINESIDRARSLGEDIGEIAGAHRAWLSLTTMPAMNRLPPAQRAALMRAALPFGLKLDGLSRELDKLRSRGEPLSQEKFELYRAQVRGIQKTFDAVRDAANAYVPPLARVHRPLGTHLFSFAGLPLAMALPGFGVGETAFAYLGLDWAGGLGYLTAAWAAAVLAIRVFAAAVRDVRRRIARDGRDQTAPVPGSTEPSRARRVRALLAGTPLDLGVGDLGAWLAEEPLLNGRPLVFVLDDDMSNGRAARLVEAANTLAFLTEQPIALLTGRRHAARAAGAADGVVRLSGDGYFERVKTGDVVLLLAAVEGALARSLPAAALPVFVARKEVGVSTAGAVRLAEALMLVFDAAFRVVERTSMRALEDRMRDARQAGTHA